MKARVRILTEIERKRGEHKKGFLKGTVQEKLKGGMMS